MTSYAYDMATAEQRDIVYSNSTPTLHYYYDRLGCIREVGDEDRRHALASEYLAAIERKERALVVAQTREEVGNVNEVIRAKLREAGKLDAGATVTTYEPVDLGEAQKRDSRFYREGQYACFIRG